VPNAESGEDFIYNMSRPTTKKKIPLVRAFRKKIFESKHFFPTNTPTSGKK